MTQVPTSNDLRLRPGVQSPVVLLISRAAVENCDVESVYKSSIRFLMASREDVVLYRQQLCIVFEGWDDDSRELIDVPIVRAFITALAARWPQWAFFFNQIDASIPMLISSLAGCEFPGDGVVSIDLTRMKSVLEGAINGMNSVYEKHGLSEKELGAQSLGLIEVVQQMM